MNARTSINSLAAVARQPLFEKMNRMWESLFEPSQRTIYLSIFRVFVAFHICKKLIVQWPYLGLLYSKGSFVHWGFTIYGIISLDVVKSHYMLICTGYLCLAVMMFFGIGRRVTIGLAFLCQEFLNETQGYVLDGGDNLLKFGLLYLTFANSFNYLSVSKPVFKHAWRERLDNFITNLAVASIIFHLMVVYFISGTAKFHSEAWFHGTGVYYCLSLDRFKGTLLNDHIVQSSLFVTMASYVTMIWETVFPFVVFNRFLRIPTLLFGAMMHLGIYIFMMINAFSIYYIANYGFFFTDSELLRFKAFCLAKYQMLRGGQVRQSVQLT